MIREDAASVTIAPTITNITSSVLQARKLLYRLVVDGDNQVYSSYENVLYDKDNTTVLAIPGGVLHSKIHPSAITIKSQAGFGTSIEEFDCSDSANLKYIQSQAFRASGIKKFIFPPSVVTIDVWAFYSCSNLTIISFSPDCIITSFSSEVFRHSGLVRVELCDSFTELGTLQDCANLGVAVISENSRISSLSDSAFRSCTKLKNFTIYPNLKTIAINAFNGCKNVVIDFSRSQLTMIDQSAFEGCISIKTIFLSNTLISIGAKAFRGCSGVTNLTFGSEISITSFGSSCFDGCSSLTEVELPKSLEKIDYSIFHRCSSLKKITISPGSSNLKANDGVVYDIQGNTLIFCSCGKDVVSVIDGVSEISGNAFFECSSLSSITFPNECNITSIKTNTFSGCINLESIEVPASVEILESGSFSGCKSLSIVKFKVRG